MQRERRVRGDRHIVLDEQRALEHCRARDDHTRDDQAGDDHTRDVAEHQPHVDDQQHHQHEHDLVDHDHLHDDGARTRGFDLRRPAAVAIARTAAAGRVDDAVARRIRGGP